jgi:hypothetical protein
MLVGLMKMPKHKNPYLITWLGVNRNEILSILTLWQVRRVISKEFFTLLGIVIGTTWEMIKTSFKCLFYMFFAIKPSEIRDIFKGDYKEFLDE